MCWGSFFPLLLRQWIALRVALVRGQLAPAVAVQQVVDRGQRHRATQSLLQFSLDLADHQDAARSSSLQQGLQRGAFLLGRHILVAATTTRRR